MPDPSMPAAAVIETVAKTSCLPTGGTGSGPAWECLSPSRPPDGEVPSAPSCAGRPVDAACRQGAEAVRVPLAAVDHGQKSLIGSEREVPIKGRVQCIGGKPECEADLREGSQER